MSGIDSTTHHPQDHLIDSGGDTGAGSEVGGIEDRPTLRGWFHVVSFFVFLVVAPWLLLESPSVGATIALLIYIASMLALFGVSGLFHRVRWAPKARRRMRRLDHSTIFIAIAGSYTAVAGLVLLGTPRLEILLVVWVGGVIGIIQRQLWIDAPKWVNAIPYIVVGWSALLVLPPLFHALGVAGFAWLMAGGLFYTIGAVAYSLKRPNPIPGVLGYHEVFHAGTVLGALCHFVVVAFFALPLARAAVG